MDKHYNNNVHNSTVNHTNNKVNINKMNQTTNKSVQTKALPDVFKELKQAQRNLAIEEMQEKNKKGFHKKKKRKNNKLQKEIYESNYSYGRTAYNVQSIGVKNHKFNEIGIIIGILFLILFVTLIKSNYIFATSKEEEEKKPIAEFEENENAINLMELMSENISDITRKDVTTEKVMLEHETIYIDNNEMPKGEEKIEQQGKDGYKEITYIRTYESNELVDEKVIGENLVKEPIEEKIQRGTSEYLYEYKVHLGDTMYTTEEIYMMNEPDEDSITICKIYEFIDVTLLSEKDGWCKIKVDGLEGYVHGDQLTSKEKSPEMPEKSRIKRIMLTLDFNMEINKPSGLTRADFKKVLSGNTNDTNKIFENNAELFYDIEQKYNVNGIFLASIGIHESNWGNSTIANDKKNLFGYGAYDSSPYESSVTFESYEYGIELLAKVLSKYYINEQGTEIYDGETAVGSYYNGPTISGVNTRYASDENWANRVFSIMTALYEKLQ